MWDDLTRGSDTTDHRTFPLPAQALAPLAAQALTPVCLCHDLLSADALASAGLPCCSASLQRPEALHGWC